MPRENSFSDSDGRSLTPDLDEAMEAEAEARAAQPATTSSSTAALRDGRPSLDKIIATSSAPASLNRPSQDVRTTQTPTTAQRAVFPTPTERFRHAVRKVMAMRRTSSMMMKPGIGAEPGIDPRRASAYVNYGWIKQQCLIEIVDYSTVRTSFGRMTNQEFVRFINDKTASRRESWAKVRWINIGGISWDVLSAVALKYDLHPLALEDVLHRRGNARSKVDYYPQHLFLRILRHCLYTEDDAGSPDISVFELPRSESPSPIGDDTDDEPEHEPKSHAADDDATVFGSASASRFASKRGTMRHRHSGFKMDPESQPPQSARFSDFGETDNKKYKNARAIKFIRELKRGDRVNVKVQPLCIFLLRDGTVISIHKDAKLGFTAPITDRLRQRDTGLRTTADPSLLVESLLDLVVDQALEVVEEYQSKILKLEQAVLLKPDMTTVRRLHIIQGDLILHKRTLEPIKTVIYGLRRYDVDRAAALSDVVDPAMKIEGFMSHKAKIYLADVHDHMEYILTSLDMFAGISDNLINYTFNMVSYEMNEVMRRLTMATIIFLPLTLLTGYFGMNFENMWSVKHEHSDVIFWIIALPVMSIVIPIFIWPDLKRMGHYLRKRFVQRKVGKVYKRA
ncbi:hypothetical protein CERSUDRAFT_118647 [Gelatoporia subvermispora B]|uniref:Magnesium transport protein CorA n=1 Tax=Ceriporiopsis subvermispora (strain B) TaxID=914234 RepID=M2PAQ4_CERS8|nr:hypothetical protein CERSUDRAFT_118647 [Gelatoporia subvermispora B]